MLFQIRSRKYFLLECFFKFAGFSEINARGFNQYLSAFRIILKFRDIPEQFLVGVVLERSSTNIILKMHSVLYSPIDSKFQKQ